MKEDLEILILKWLCFIRQAIYDDGWMPLITSQVVKSEFAELFRNFRDRYANGELHLKV
jgi:hypothetical protein